MSVVVERARPEDMAGVLELLRGHGLPSEGLQSHFGTTVVAKDGIRIVGSAALEIYADGALLRSVAVASDRQGLGLGRDLTSAAIRLGQTLGVQTLYLLTTTAEGYFPKLGFEPITRADVPASVQTSVEFTSACPASAVVMRRLL